MCHLEALISLTPFPSQGECRVLEFCLQLPGKYMGVTEHVCLHSIALLVPYFPRGADVGKLTRWHQPGSLTPHSHALLPHVLWTMTLHGYANS